MLLAEDAVRRVDSRNLVAQPLFNGHVGQCHRCGVRLVDRAQGGGVGTEVVPGNGPRQLGKAFGKGLELGKVIHIDYDFR